MSKKIAEGKEFPKIKRKNKLLIMSLVGFVIIIGIFGAIGAWWVNSPNHTYYQISQAIINEDLELFQEYSDSDQIIDNFKETVLEAADPRIDQEFIEGMKRELDLSKLANNLGEAFSGKLKREDNKYFFETSIASPALPDDKYSVPITAYITKEDSGWKLTKLFFDYSKFGLSEPLDVNTVEYDIAFGTKQRLNAIEMSIYNVAVQESFTKPDEFFPDEIIELKPVNPNNKLVRTSFLFTNLSNEAVDFTDYFSFQLVNEEGVKYDSTTSLENIYSFDLEDDELYPYSVEYDFSSINPQVSISHVLTFEVPKDFQTSSSYIEYNNEYAYDPQSPEVFESKFRLE
ncbi:MAG: hypothetical protein AAGF07_02370 [Patescibacteria group bacterium]